MSRTFAGATAVGEATFTFTGNSPREIAITNEDATDIILVRIPQIHGSDDFGRILPGQTRRYRNLMNAIRSVVYKAVANTPLMNIDITIGGQDPDST